MGRVYLGVCIDGDPYKQGIMAQGRMLVFSMGSYIGELPTSYNIGSIQEVDILSILDEGEYIELAAHIGGVFTKYELKLSQEVFFEKTLSIMKKGYTYRGERFINLSGVVARQTFVVFPQGVLTTEYIRGEFLENGRV